MRSLLFIIILSLIISDTYNIMEFVVVLLNIETWIMTLKKIQLAYKL